MPSRALLGICAILAIQVSLTARSDTAPAASTAAQPSAATEPGAAFSVREYRVEGNTLIAAAEVERALEPYVGAAQTAQDVEAARANLEQLFHDRGYQTVLVEVPKQDVTDESVRLVVVETVVGKVAVNGAKHHSARAIEAAIPDFKPGTVPNFNAVQKELAQVDRAEDLRVTPVLRESSTPGQIDVDLNVQDKLPLHGSLELNNRYSADTSHLRLVGSVDYDDLFDQDQTLSLQYQTAPERPDEVKVWSLSYLIPMSGGPYWAVYALRSDSNVAAVGDINVIGKGKIFGVRYDTPLTSADADFIHSVTMGVDYKDFDQDVIQPGAAPGIAEPARYVPLTLQYNATWLGGDDANHHTAATTYWRSSTQFDTSFEYLNRALVSDPAQFAANRPGARPTFFILHSGLTRQQILPWNFSLFAKADGQWASGPLIINEQYGAGGAESVRGYTESERLGDDAVRATLELRTPQLIAGPAAPAGQSYAYLFVDRAVVHADDAQPTEPSGYHLASEGIGARYKSGGLLIEVDGARAETQGYVTRPGSISAQFRLVYTW